MYDLRNAWHHYVVAHSGAVTTVQLDGVQLAASELSVVAESTNIDGSPALGWEHSMGAFELLTDVFIGSRMDSNADLHFKGLIAGLAVTSEVVSDSTAKAWFFAQAIEWRQWATLVPEVTRVPSITPTDAPVSMSTYANNAECRWLLACNAAPVVLTITRLDLEAGRDFLRVHDGVDSFAPLMSVLTGTTVVRINFQPSSMATPVGYLADSGSLLGDKGNGFVYGWSNDLGAAGDVRDRDSLHTRESSLIIPDRDDRWPGEESWSIFLPNGTYSVEIGYFDIGYDLTTASCKLQGSAAGVGTLSAGQGDTFARTVVVTEGQLTFSGQFPECGAVGWIHVSLASISVVSTGAELFLSFLSDHSTSRDGFFGAVECPNGAIPRGMCCNDFSSEPSVANKSCIACTGGEQADCLSATCLSPGTAYANGICCSDFDTVPSVESRSCTSCTGDQADECTAATCAAGFTPFFQGVCCNDMSG
eukprot:COSAG02_NODE_3909_length_6056_cov_3.448884_1_plen_475_part_10